MNDPAGWAGNLLVMVNTSPLGCVAQLGEVKVNPLSVPASRGKAWKVQSRVIDLKNAYFMGL